MKNVPSDISGFTALDPWWRTGVPTCILCSGNGIDDILRKIKQEDVQAFFLVDSVLEKQPLFAPLFIEQSKMLFNASASEPRTADVDQIVEFLRSRDSLPDVIVGVGGGSTMDLAKAVGICLANPGKARDYQGYGMDLKKGPPVWVLPTLNGTGAEITPIAVLRGPEKKTRNKPPLRSTCGGGDRSTSFLGGKAFQQVFHHDGLLFSPLRNREKQDQFCGRCTGCP